MAASSGQKIRPAGIMDLFAQQEVTKFVSCPVCSADVKLSAINMHLDNNCHESLQGSAEVSELKKRKLTLREDVVKTGAELADVEMAFGDANSRKSVASAAKDIRDVELKCQSSKVENGTESQQTKHTVLGKSGDTKIIVAEEVDLSLELDADDRVPYYIKNFKTILQEVLEYDSHLFNLQDKQTLDAFYSMPENAQRLYIRMFSRKHDWLRRDKLNYSEISNMSSPLQELFQLEFLQTAEKIDDLPLVLRLLLMPEMKELMKLMHIKAVGMNKPQMSEALIKHSQRQMSIFGSMSSNITNKARKLLGECYRLESEKRSVFVRVMLLFSMHNIREEEENSQQQLFTMLLVNTGKLVYPTYQIARKHVIFADRDIFLRFQQAMEVYHKMQAAIEKNCVKDQHDHYIFAAELYAIFDRDDDMKRHDTNLPTHLKKFAPLAVLTRVLWRGVEALQRMKKYEEAVVRLGSLLHADYCPQLRGRWWERVTLNLCQHLKRPDECIDKIKLAMGDGHVPRHYRLSLYQRAQKVCQSAVRMHRLEEVAPFEFISAPKKTIEGRLLPKQMEGRKHIFITDESYQSSSSDVVTLGVEQLALRHYGANGHENGIHGEGGTFCTLLALFMWDVIFSEETVADIFRSSYQSAPLDFHSTSFYSNRKLAIDRRLKEIAAADTEMLERILSDSWQAHEGVTCSGLNWERFDDLEHAKGLVSCVGGRNLSEIFGRICKEQTRSGMPDLTVWDTSNKKWMAVEVKGPGDRLSTKQILWLDFLVTIGVAAEVCHVVAIASKRLQHKRDVVKQSD